MRKESKHISTKKSTEHKGRQQERKRGQKSKKVENKRTIIGSSLSVIMYKQIKLQSKDRVAELIFF